MTPEELQEIRETLSEANSDAGHEDDDRAYACASYHARQLRSEVPKLLDELTAAGDRLAAERARAEVFRLAIIKAEWEGVGWDESGSGALDSPSAACPWCGYEKIVGVHVESCPVTLARKP